MCWRSDSLMPPSTLISILCDGFRASNFPPSSGTHSSTPQAANRGAISENLFPNQHRVPSPTTRAFHPRLASLSAASSFPAAVPRHRPRLAHIEELLDDAAAQRLNELPRVPELPPQRGLRVLVVLCRATAVERHHPDPVVDRFAGV